MNTKEHTALGNALRLKHVRHNPYLRVDEEGVLHLRLQRFTDPNSPEPMELELSAGEIIAMAGDYFTQADWTFVLNLPHCETFDSPVTLGRYLINQKITQDEQNALLSAYNNLAAPDVTREQIERIYDINNSDYVPFSSALTFYAQQVMLYFRVKNYGEMITRNQTHFTPWSVKVYVLGHSIALRYAQLSAELKKLAKDERYCSDNADFMAIKEQSSTLKPNALRKEALDLAHRYHALAYCMELFTFHYYSDHFATGHMSMLADLRIELGNRFGNLGNILANNLHDEVNRIGLYTNKPYDPTPNNKTAAIRSRGDGKFDSCLNEHNRKACIAGMTDSFKDLAKVLEGGAIPPQKEFGGLEHMPDVDFNVRQHQPLLVFSNGKIFRRQHLSLIKIISPSEYDSIRANPIAHGYVEVSNKWDVFVLVTKLRLFPYIYEGAVQPVSKEEKSAIRREEKQRNPQRHQIHRTHCKAEADPNALDWRDTKENTLTEKTPKAEHRHRHRHRFHSIPDFNPESRKKPGMSNKEWLDTLDGLKRNSVLTLKDGKSRVHKPVEHQAYTSSRIQ